MNRMNLIWVMVLALGCAMTGHALPLPGMDGKPKVRHRLYTPPDPSATGGCKGIIILPSKPLETVLAIPPDNPDLVYEAKITEESDHRGFLFENLPMARYDLVVVYADEFFEGLELTRGEDTLTDADREKIKYIVTESDPFFTKKILHRIEGTTGRGNFARCIVTQYRDRAALDSDYTDLKGFRRTFKLIWLKDVGVGWQVVQKRDLYPLTVQAGFMNPPHFFSKALSKIRVTDQMKDLGIIELKSK